MMPRKPSLIRRAAARGASLIFALMTLAVLSLGAVALVRTVDIGALILGNLNFKQDATTASALATQQALAFLDAGLTGGAMDADVPASGYYANSQEKLDPTGRLTSEANKLALVDWDRDGKCAYAKAGTFSACNVLASPEVTVNGNRARWVITRMCKKSEMISPTNPCSKPSKASESDAVERGEISSGGRLKTTVTSPYYRVIVRTEGARNTVSFTETIVHF